MLAGPVILSSPRYRMHSVVLRHVARRRSLSYQMGCRAGNDETSPRLGHREAPDAVATVVSMPKAMVGLGCGVFYCILTIKGYTCEAATPDTCLHEIYAYSEWPSDEEAACTSSLARPLRVAGAARKQLHPWQSS